MDCFSDSKLGRRKWQNQPTATTDPNQGEGIARYNPTTAAQDQKE